MSKSSNNTLTGLVTNLSRRKARGRTLIPIILRQSLTRGQVDSRIHLWAKRRRQLQSYCRRLPRKPNSLQNLHNPKKLRMREEEARMVKSLLTSQVSPIRSSRSPKSNRDLLKSKKISNLQPSLNGVFVRMSLLRTAAKPRINYCQSRHVADKQVNSKVKSQASPKVQRSHRLNWLFKINLNPTRSHLINSQAPQHLEGEAGPESALDLR